MLKSGSPLSLTWQHWPTCPKRPLARAAATLTPGVCYSFATVPTTPYCLSHVHFTCCFEIATPGVQAGEAPHMGPHSLPLPDLAHHLSNIPLPP